MLIVDLSPRRDDSPAAPDDRRLPLQRGLPGRGPGRHGPAGRSRKRRVARPDRHVDPRAPGPGRRDRGRRQRAGLDQAGVGPLHRTGPTERSNDDPIVRQELVRLYIAERVLTLMGQKMRDEIAAGIPVGSKGSVAKLATALISRQSASVGMAIAGPASQAWDAGDATAGLRHRHVLLADDCHRRRYQRDPAQHDRRAGTGPAEGAPGRSRRPVPRHPAEPAPAPRLDQRAGAASPAPAPPHPHRPRRARPRHGRPARSPPPAGRPGAGPARL